MPAQPRQIFEYLWALKNLTSPPVRRVHDYEWLRFAADLPAAEGCYLFGAGARDPESWLEVHRQDVPPPPEPPVIVREWLSTPWNDPEAEPEFVEERVIKPPYGFGDGEPAPRERFEDSPERVSQFMEWWQRWSDWAAVAKPKQQVQRLYGELFALRHRFEREGELIEMCFGHGLLTWQYGAARIERPILVTRVDLLFDAKQGVMTLKPTTRGTVLETEMLSGLDLETLPDVVRLERSFRDNPLDPTDAARTEPFCHEFAHALHPEGRYQPEPELVPAGSKPVVSARTCLFVRRRSAELWKQELRSVLTALDGGFPVPPTIQHLVAVPEAPADHGGSRSMAEGGGGRPGLTEGEILFPLPANEDQREICRRLETHTGVTVQGPPGTGKSHTIANLISHILAQGKRVLVTSQSEKALRVLKEKIPKEIADLCVPVLGADHQSLQEIGNSIRAIQERLATTDVDRVDQEMVQIRRDLMEARSKIASLKQQLRQVAESEHATLAFHGETLTRSEIAKRVADQESEHGWLPDSIPLGTESPLTHSALERIWALLGQIDPDDLQEASRALPHLGDLMAPAEFAGWINRGAELAAAARRARQGVEDFGLPEDRANLIRLNDLLAPVVRERELLEIPYLRRVVADALGSAERLAVWSDLISTVRQAVPGLAQLAASLAEYSIELPDRPLPEILADLELLGPALVGGRPGSLFMLRNGRRLRYLLDGRIVDGRGIDSPERARVLTEYIRLTEQRQRLTRKWNNLLATIDGPSVDAGSPRWFANLDDATALLERAVTLGEHVRRLRGAATSLRLPAGFDWSSWTSYEPLVDAVAVEHVAMEHREWDRDWQSKRDSMLEQAGRQDAASVWHQLANAIRTKDPAAWEQGYNRAVALQTTATRAAELEELLARLAPAAPRWTAQIRGMIGRPQPFPWDWPKAWQWSQLNTWLKATEVDAGAMEQHLEEEQTRERRLITRLVAVSTWARQIRRVTPSQRRALFAWKARLDRIGKGTGKYVAVLRDEARREMDQAQGAIPAWIMPIHRVIESFGLSENRFDVVIVDESSQCDVFSLSVLLRADKAIIVGDDQQISPAAVGIDQAEVRKLIAQHLTDVPQASSFDLQSSLYDHAVRIFPGTIMLREHFRCVPEIIQFSNDLCYDGRIIPLRLPQLSERIEPPVVCIRVPGFVDQLAARNLIEAKQIVADIQEMIAMPCYARSTMGVISLVGADQAMLIQDLLRAAIGEEAMEQHRIICGDAYAFQGDERDIMFLSMVSATNVRFQPLVRRDARQRFNVAVSRARDQLRLYHSVDLEDLNPGDMRAHLLSYCRNPGRIPQAYGEAEARCESPFERDVLRALVAEGYAVTPQVQVGRFRIDLVVQGMRSRLAVECDGDRWHGIDHWEQDLARQQVLERAGWTFARIRASAFYRDRKGALAPVWAAIERLAIEPRLLAGDR